MIRDVGRGKARGRLLPFSFHKGAEGARKKCHTHPINFFDNPCCMIIVSSLYRGSMAAQIVKDIQSAGGFITLTDLSGYRAIERGPLRTKVKDLELLTTPPPGSGALISLALKIMAGLFEIYHSLFRFKNHMICSLASAE